MTMGLEPGGAMEPVKEAVKPLFDCGYEPGIYFGLPDEEYHKIPALSSTGIKRLAIEEDVLDGEPSIGAPDFWALSWMNPWLEEDLEEEGESEAKIIGKAYHKRMLEGKEAFEAEYAPAFSCDDKDVLKGNDALKAFLKKKGATGYSSKNKDALIDLVLKADPKAKIYERIEAEYKAEHEGKIFLGQKLIDKIERSTALLERHPTFRKLFSGGYPEVSVIWYCPDTGIPMKVRFDYLKLKAIPDLKTYANFQNKPIKKAICGAMASNKYHVQGSLYLEASDIMREFARKGAFHALQPVDEAWVKKLGKSPSHEFWFVFQQKGIAPRVRLMKFPRKNIYRCGLVTIERAKERFLKCWRHYGPDTPWLDMTQPDEFEDMDLPDWAYET